MTTRGPTATAAPDLARASSSWPSRSSARCVFVLYAITVRDASQIPLLAAGGVVLGIVFLALAAYTLRATWRAGHRRRGTGARSALGVGGGIAAIIGAGCIAGRDHPVPALAARPEPRGRRRTALTGRARPSGRLRPSRAPIV